MESAVPSTPLFKWKLLVSRFTIEPFVLEAANASRALKVILCHLKSLTILCTHPYAAIYWRTSMGNFHAVSQDCWTWRPTNSQRQSIATQNVFATSFSGSRWNVHMEWENGESTAAEELGSALYTPGKKNSWKKSDVNNSRRLPTVRRLSCDKSIKQNFNHSGQRPSTCMAMK